MALVDPNIAMSYRGIEVPNQLAQYGQVQQIQAAQRQNRLADAQMAEYERKQNDFNRLRALDPSATGYINEVMRIDPQLGSELSLRQQQRTTAERQAASAESEIRGKNLSVWQSLARDAAQTPSDDVLRMLARQSVSLGVADEATAEERYRQIFALAPADRAKALSQFGAAAAVPNKPTPAETEEIVMRLQDPNLPPPLRQALQSRLTMLTTREPKKPEEPKDDLRKVVAFRETDAAGNVTLINKFGEVITPSAPVKGKPSATFEKTTAQRKQMIITAKNGRTVVAAAGNAGNIAHHLLHQPTVTDTLFTWFVNNSSNSIYIELWADTADLRNVKFSLGSDALNPIYFNVAQDQWMGINGNVGVLRNDSLMSFTGNRLARYQTYGQLIGNKYSFIFYILPDSTFNYFRLMSTGNGKFDVWSFDMIDYGLPAPGTYPNISNYVLPDYNKTICSSFQASDKVITVGQYVNRNNYIDYNGNLQTFPTTEGALAVSSSKGPTRDGRLKPDITSTGEYTMSALPASAQAWFIANQPFKLAYDGKHIRDGGTSSAAPVVAGVAALYFEAFPNASWQDVKNKIMYCSKADQFTGSNLPNNNWGHGKLDAMLVMTGCSAAGTTSLNNLNFSCYPNPSRDIIHLNFKTAAKRTIEIYSVLGTCLNKFETSIQENEITVSKYENGVYFLQITEGNQTQTEKLIIQK